MPVNPKIQLFLDQLNALPQVPMDQVTPEAYRSMESKSMNFPQQEESVEKVEDRVLKLEGRDIPIRVYTPKNGKAPNPGLIAFTKGKCRRIYVDCRDDAMVQKPLLQ